RSSHQPQLALRARAQARALESQRADERAARIKEGEPHRTPALGRNLGLGKELVTGQARDRQQRIHAAVTDADRLRGGKRVLPEARVATAPEASGRTGTAPRDPVGTARSI